MYTYTTPTISCVFPGFDFSNVDYVRIAIKSSNHMIVRIINVEDIDTEKNVAYVHLTQEETVEFGVGNISIQARIHYIDGSVLPTNECITKMKDALDKEII
jgi:hypothetical protein